MTTAPTSLRSRLAGLAADPLAQRVQERTREVLGGSMPLFRTVRNVGVIGLYQSGKTTLLTALIAHLRHHDPARFSLGRDRRDRPIEVFPPHEIDPDEGLPRFGYEAHRARLSAEKRWPAKTAVVSQYRAELAFAHEARRAARLTLLDCPGERLADLPMAGRSHATWSAWMLAQLRTPECAAHAGEFLSLVDAGCVDESALLAAFRRTLARLALAYTPIVSPSTFVLDETGHEIAPHERTVDAMAISRHAGLDADRQFCPLSEAQREQDPALAGRLAERFDAYRRGLVEPVARWLRRCHHLVVLVDIPMILSGGLGMLRAHTTLIDQILRDADPGFSAVGEALRRVTALAGVPLPGVRTVSFVAAKADQVLPEDRLRLDSLLRQLVREPVRRHQSRAEHLTVEHLIVSAVRSTGQTADGRLVGELANSGPAGEESSFTVSRLPERWPEGAEWPEYRFARVRPRAPANELYPPEHSGLHLLARSILGLPSAYEESQ